MSNIARFGILKRSILDFIRQYSSNTDKQFKKFTKTFIKCVR